MSTRTVTLRDIPSAGEELEDYIASLFQASGHYVEKCIVEADPADILELDIVATNYSAERVDRLLVEVKGGKWGYTDLFKVAGWMQYLNMDQSAFFITRWDDRATATKRMEPLGMKVVKFDSFATAPQEFEEQGFGKLSNPDVINLWRHSYSVERKLIATILTQAKATESDAANTAKQYHRLINNGTFLARGPEESLMMLYGAFQSHPKLSLGYANELDGGTFDPTSPNPDSSSYRAALYEGKHPELQACMYLEHRAKLAILKAAIDYAVKYPDGRADLVSSGTIDWDGITYRGLPQSFHNGSQWLIAQPTYKRYAILWQQFLLAWGGFYLEDRRDREFSWMSEQSGIPVDEIPVALTAFDQFFPVTGGWFTTPGKTSLCMLKMTPMLFQGIGSHFRHLRYDLDNTQQTFVGFTQNDLAQRITCVVDFLLNEQD